jgi:hypothetical protein
MDRTRYYYRYFFSKINRPNLQLHPPFELNRYPQFRNPIQKLISTHRGGEDGRGIHTDKENYPNWNITFLVWANYSPFQNLFFRPFYEKGMTKGRVPHTLRISWSFRKVPSIQRSLILRLMHMLLLVLLYVNLSLMVFCVDCVWAGGGKGGYGNGYGTECIKYPISSSDVIAQKSMHSMSWKR